MGAQGREFIPSRYCGNQIDIVLEQELKKTLHRTVQLILLLSSLTLGHYHI